MKVIINTKFQLHISKIMSDMFIIKCYILVNYTVLIVLLKTFSFFLSSHQKIPRLPLNSLIIIVFMALSQMF